MYSKILLLRFPPKIADKAIAVNLVKRFDLSFNILKATIYPRKEGMMVLELTGTKKNYNFGIKYLKDIGVKVERVSHDIKKNDDKCFHCGACTAVCPTGALYIERPQMTIAFNEDKCSACELCVLACPAKAMEVNFDRGILE